MGGYDRRRHLNRKRNIGYTQYPSGLPKSYTVAEAVSSVVSYRSEPTGQIVLDKDADPYAWFLNSSSTRRIKNAKQHSLLGSQKEPVLDNGHTFSMQLDETIPLQGKGRWFPWYGAMNSCTGGPITTGGGVINYLNETRMLFKYAQSGDAARQFGVSFPLSSAFDPTYWGQKAITTLAPTRPNVNIAVALGEVLREGVPRGLIDDLAKISTGPLKSLRGFKPPKEKGSLTFKQALTGDLKDLTRAASSDYLNYMFGIMPLVRDMDRLYQTLLKASEIIAQFERDAGSGVRRSMQLVNTTRREIFLPTHLENQGECGVRPNAYPQQVVGGSSTTDVGSPVSTKTTVTQTSIERIWFSGSFSYFLPVPAGFAGKVEHASSLWNRLYGAPISWEAVWALKPWSWLLDWFFDIQSAIAAVELNQNEGLVLNYGYLMRQTKMMTLVESELTWAPTQLGGVTSVRTLYSSETKRRYRANPFGFALTTPTALSGIQWSLLAAIGFTR